MVVVGTKKKREKIRSNVCLRARVGLASSLCFSSLFVPGRLAPGLTLSVKGLSVDSLPACPFVSACLSLCSFYITIVYPGKKIKIFAGCSLLSDLESGFFKPMRSRGVRYYIPF